MISSCGIGKKDDITPRKITVMYIDHNLDISGGPISLINKLKFLNEDKINPIIVCDPQGSLHKELLRLNFEVKLVRMNRNNAHETVETYIHRNPCQLLSNVPITIGALRKLSEIVQETQADIIHSNSFKGAVLASFTAILTNRPFIYHMHISQKQANHGWLDKIVFSTSTRIIANSNYTAESINPRWREKVLVIYPPVDPRKFDLELSDGTEFKQKIGVNKKTKLVATIGRITPVKRQEDFIRAAYQVEKEFSDIKFLIVGGIRPGFDQYKNKLQDLVSKLGLTDKVIFTGFRNDVNDIIAAIDIMVLPSLEESFGKIVVESLLLKTPVISTKVGGVPEIIEHNKSGFLIPPKSPKILAKKILQLLQNGDLANDLALNGHQRVTDRFSAEAIAHQHEKLYFDIVRNISR